MADPKGAPEESPTRTFQLKLDGWMEEALKLDLDAAPDPAAPTQPPAQPGAGITTEVDPTDPNAPKPPTP
jgi:hypothetical protein